MKKWHLAIVVPAAVSGALGVVYAQPSTPGSASAASASASVRPPPSPKEWAEPVQLADMTIPTTVSERPKRDEWKDAPNVEVLSRTDNAKRCSAQLLREYMRVSCPQVMGGIRQFVGSTKDVELFIYAKDDTNIWREPNGGDVVFPLRKGEAYLFQFFQIEDGYEGFGLRAATLVDVTWSGGRKGPTVVLR